MPQVISSDPLDLTVPKSWEELSDKQLERIFRLIALERVSDEVAVLIFLYLAGLEVIGRNPDKNYLMRHGKRFLNLDAAKLAAVSESTDFLLLPPKEPVRISRWRRRSALPADLEDVDFETYIIIDNLYQGFLFTQNNALIDQIAAVLYPGIKGACPDFIRINCIFWISSLKTSLSKRFPDFFSGVPGSDDPLSSGKISPQAVQDAMNAQIRALTKGDITKEEQVLKMDLYRALTELNTQAKEYKELNAKIKKN